MIFDAIRYYRDTGIQYRTEGHKHCSIGWVHIPCPFCRGNPGWHLGFHLTDSFYSCWRCGGHSIKKVVKALSGCSWRETTKIISRYRSAYKIPANDKTSGLRKRIKELILPPGTGSLNKAHKSYLKSRGFDPDKLEKDWGLLGTNHTGPYKFRIIAPIYQYGKLVSYQGRDYTEKSKLKYKACKKELEVIDHKHCLYGLDNVPGSKVVLNEGITDTWRLGFGSVNSFGIKYRREQAKKLRRFDEVFIFYDPDPQAIEQAEKIAAYLAMYKKDVHIIELKNKNIDPGELPQQYADDLMKELVQED